MEKFDILGAYLHTETKYEVIMVLEVPLSKFMVKVDPKLYRKCVTINRKVKPILYVKTHKSLYGLLISALIFKILVNDLEVYGFIIY